MKFTNYQDMVDYFLRNDSPDVFGNFSPDHAQYIIRRFIDSANLSIDILSGSLADAFYDHNDIYSTLERAARRIALNPGGRVRIVTSDGKTNERLVALCESVNKSCKDPVIQYCPATYLGDTPLKHFMVVDRKRYRLEDVHEKLPEGEIPKCVKAEVCCNGVSKATDLEVLFSGIWNILNPQQEGCPVNG